MPEITRRLAKPLALLALLGALCCVPLFIQRYELHITIVILSNIILVSSYRFLTLTGEWSVAHHIAMGMGSYTAALLAVKLGWPFLAVLPMGILASFLFGFIIGLVSLRTRGMYFLLATWAFGEAMRLSWIRFDGIFGGYRGISRIPDPVIDLPGLPRVEFTGEPSYYYLIMVLAVISFAIMYRLEKSRIGLTLGAVRESNQLAESTGINVLKFKLLGIGVASVFAGVVGVFYAYFVGFISPSSFSLVLALNIILFLVAGGVGHVAGPVVGTIFFVLVGEQLRPLKEFIPLIFGVILIVVLVVLPRGLISLPGVVASTVRKALKKFHGAT